MTMMKDSSLRKSIIAAFFGNALEFYDFSLFGFVTPYIAKEFFSAFNDGASMLSSFAAFAVAFIARPIGGLFFGAIGDKYGRKPAFSLSIFLMAFSTLSLGCLPSFSTIGYLSIFLLIFFRCLQGLSTGGEFTGASLFLIERFADSKRGFASSLVVSSCSCGVLLAAITLKLCVMFSAEWGWRCAFIIGGGIGFFGLYIRLKLPEEGLFNQTLPSQKYTLLKDIIVNRKEAIIRAIGLGICSNVLINTTVVYSGIYLQQTGKVTLQETFAFSAFTLLIMAVASPFFGIIADRRGFKKVLFYAAFIATMSALPIFMLLNSGRFLLILIGLATLGLLTAAFAGICTAYLSNIFPLRERFRGLALGYNIALALCGGTTPAICYFLISVSGNVLMPALYVILAGIVGLSALKEGKHVISFSVK